MSENTIEYSVLCKRCQDPKKPVRYSGMLFEKNKEFGFSRPLYCDECRRALLAEKMTMGAAYFSLKTLPGCDLSDAIPGELGKVFHPELPHIKSEKPKNFDASKFGATPGKIVEIYEWLKDFNHQVVIVKGGTGSGKSTALPYWLVYPPAGIPSDFFTRDGQICITQPRILATTGVSSYLGSLMGSTVGKGFDVGYRYSKDRNADKSNAVFLATDGTLINMIKNGELADLSVVMIDEAHERSLNIDIILHLLKDLLPLYPHLKVLIVSATINAESFLNYFGNETAKLVEFEAKSKFEYKVNYADESEKINYEDPIKLKKQLVGALVKKVVCLLKEQADGKKPYGHILCFLQGVNPIKEAVKSIRSIVEVDQKLKYMVEVLPLYSALSEDESDRAIKISEPSRIRVIVATNVAEASITVDGVVYVVETGVENQAQWEVEETKKSVELRLISKANAKQRFGRSGRTRNGEVFCLYTKNQFEKMLDFPVPAIQRSSMEEIILKLKELGIDDYENRWIDPPIKEELDRSIVSLKKIKAIDDDNMLTEYGALLSKFAYPASLADLIIFADTFGCAVEVATLLPIIKNGGYRSFLAHDTSWDESMKQKVEKIQKVLWKDCNDDVEFFFRMYCFWKNPPESPNAKVISVIDRRKEFADNFFVNFEMFEDIEKEKESVMRLLSGHRHDRNTRDLQFELINRVRMVLAYCVTVNSVGKGTYGFKTKLQSAEAVSALCDLSISRELIHRILDLRSKKVSFLKLAKEMKNWEAEMGVMETTREVKERILKKPELPVLETEGFQKFVDKYEVGDELVVEVVGYVEHATDHRVSLTVKEMELNYETWLTPSDITFTQSSAVVKQIPLGTKLRVCVKSIEPEASFVRLFCLPLVEVELEKNYQKMKKVDGQIVTCAKVIDVRTDNKVVFVAELSKPEEGFVLVVHASEKVLTVNKPVREYAVGETYFVKFKVEPGFEYRSRLAVVSEKLKIYLEQPSSRLRYADGQLIFKEKMRYLDLIELSKIDKDRDFLAALDYLYLTSHLNWASKVSDAGWMEKIKKRFDVNQLVVVKVVRNLNSGAIVSLPDDQTTGYVKAHSSLDRVKEGEILKAKIIGFDEERQQVNLSFSIPENSPLIRFNIGEVLTGEVVNLQSFGAFISLGLGFTGLIHVSKMGKRVSNPNELLSKGDRVRVEILDMKEESGRHKISLRLISVEKDRLDNSV